MEYLKELEPLHDRAKSFYHNAEIFRDDNGTIYLKSYGTFVAKIIDTAVTGTDKPIVEIKGWYSNTTARHINEFLKQYNIIDRGISKKEIEEW